MEKEKRKKVLHTHTSYPPGAPTILSEPSEIPRLSQGVLCLKVSGTFVNQARCLRLQCMIFNAQSDACIIYAGILQMTWNLLQCDSLSHTWAAWRSLKWKPMYAFKIKTVKWVKSYLGGKKRGSHIHRSLSFLKFSGILLVNSTYTFDSNVSIYEKILTNN